MLLLISFSFIAFLAVALDDSKCYPYSSLTSFHLIACPQWITERLLFWVCPGTEPNRSLTSLDVTSCYFEAVSPVLAKLPALRKLSLGNSIAPKGCIARRFYNFENLEWLNLTGCCSLTGEELYGLSVLVGKTLRHLSLAKLSLITDTDLRDLVSMFPVLRSLNLSRCLDISDAILVEWYIKNDKLRWPKLRRLILKGCDQISQEVISSVRHKTRNQLLIDT